MNYSTLKTIQESPFGNTYGSLDLVKDEDGSPYLKIGDCMGDDFFGPLSPEQVAAFELLCQVQRVS